MAGPTRPTRPSAFDGYRRLERTRRVAAGVPVQAATAVVPPRRRPARSARAAGFVRLACFVAVLAIIVGTSVGLASADTRAQARRDATTVDVRQPSTPRETAPDRETAPAAMAAADEPAADTLQVGEAEGVAEAAASTDDVRVAVAGAKDAPVARAGTGSSLPFTGEPSLDRFLLAGAALVLLGMLVQIAGQPLPDRARARVR